MTGNTQAISFSKEEKEILRRVQGTLPDSATPYKDIAEEVGVEEDRVIALLKSLKEKGMIRRFGATLRHQHAGYDFNAMVAWYVEADKDIDEVGRHMAERPEITHCYERKNCYDWPYNMYTMIHGRSREDCLQTVEALSEETGIEQYEILFSYEELKKTSMRYF